MEPHKKESGTQNGNSSLQPSQGVLESGTVAVQSEASTISGNEKFNANQELMPDSIPGQVTHQPLQAPATQQPSKKKGFQITSVKDPGDGEESADELDESHTSYSDMSYSRTTDMDHDQESSASEDTLNTTVQDGISQLVSGQAPTVTNALDGSVKGGGVKPTAQNVVVNHSQTGQLDLSKDNEQKKDNVKSPAGTPAVDAKELLLGDKAPTLPQNSQSAQTKAPTKVVGSTSNTSHTTDTTTTTTSTAAGSKVTTSTSGSLAKGGASRVYKVVKRESFQPVKRERARWTCFDYLDAQSPNLVFVAHSASDTRLNYHEPPMHPANNLPTSMSATSVLSSSSSFNLQHSDSSSSIIRESFHNAAMVTSVQHSASTSSVNYDLENRKMQRLTNVRPLDETEEKRRLSLEERTEASGQDVIKSAIQSYVDLSTSEDEGSSTRSVRIDNKIEAAMDLVKKHLMLAVRDEVDELKEKIVELQDDNLKMKKENDLLKGVLTPEQQNAVQQVLSRAFTQPQKSTSLQPSQTTIPGYNLPIQGIQSLDIAAPTPNQVTPTQQPLATGQANPTIHHGYAQQPAANTGNIQLQPMHLNPALITAQGSIPILQQQPQQQGQQQPPNATLAQKPGALAAITTVQSQFQQTQSLYQPVSVTQQAQLTQQQVQALLQQQQQQQQVYPQAAAQQGYQAQASTPTVGSQQPVQASQHLPTQATTYQGQPGALAGSYAPTQTPFPPQQPQTRPVAQPGTALGMPRQQQQQQQGTNVAASITSPTNSGPTLNQPQQTFQASTPTHVTNPASTYSTFIQTSAATSGGKPTEPRVTQS